MFCGIVKTALGASKQIYIMTTKKKKETTTEDLAIMIGKGFNEMCERTEILGKENAREHKRIEKRMDSLEEGQEEIKLQLDNVAYRFELVKLRERVDVLEERAGVA